MKIVDVIGFNDGYAYVLDENYTLTYERHGSLLIGSDDTKTFFKVLQYAPCGGNPNFGGNYAFGGAKFDLPMKDGTKMHCYGQYWDGGYGKAEKILGICFSDFVHGTIESLASCYVFRSGMVCKTKLKSLKKDFAISHPGYTPWDYWEYEKHIKGEKKNG